ncbi:hypothetical protein GR160_01415 [Flavobacterium sp. Sd200]|uniref:T9SS type A sorting domain-containing protein n=1 Tax=Flavobacterium sp. Sd200 TaxID=2692211 RepID=UPI00136B3BC0|nr:T9SS type A sorting domain-containing protein [Flavobacterium sp. Sd200]MXN89872.1 hypothetical protein [Flavobacterium sp. Sd200]
MKAFYSLTNLKNAMTVALFTVFSTAVNAQCTAETVWNGNAWSNGVPALNVRAVISGNYTASANLSACSLSVTNGAQVILNAGTTLTVQNNINVSSNSQLTINNNASLVQINDGAVNTGNVTVKRNSSQLFRLDYTLWSSPVAAQNILAFSPQTSTNRFYEYRYAVEANTGAVSGQYFNINAATTNFTAGNAYLIRMPNADVTPGYNAGTTALTFEGVFTGTPNNGVITKELSTQGERYTSVGNPYASPININDFYTANTNVLDAGAALYFWRKKSDTNAGSYVAITRDAYVYNHVEGSNGQFGGEQWDELFNVNTSEENWVINAGQGFFVRTAQNVANPVLMFNNAMRRGDVHNNQFFRTAQPADAQKSRLWLNLAGNNGFSQTAIVYSNTATLGIDYGRDGMQITSGAVSFYSLAQQTTQLTIQARPEFTANDVVPMGYVADATGTYTISVHRADGVFENGQEIFIKDNQTGVIHNLATDYTFTTAMGTFNNRFEVMYRSAALSSNTPVLTTDEVMVYKKDGAINIATGTAQMTDVLVFDMNGRMVYSRNNVNALEMSVTGLNAAQEVLIVQINTVKGKVNKKIVF